jgi:hypothetical protein
MTEALLRALREPRRNKYFYGKLLDVSHFQMEQCYGIDKRRLLNRLALGSGVLCGLSVIAGTDGTVCVSPGVAIDGYGREIVVSAPSVPIRPDQPTDANGLPSGDKLTGGQSTVYLCYAECDAEPTAVYVSECDGVATTAASTTVERYRVIVRPGLPAGEPPSLTAAQRNAIFPGEPPPGYDRRIATEEALDITCPEPPEMPCVVLATVTLPADGAAQSVDNYTHRVEVFSNTVLFELIAALADRVDACCAALHPSAPQIAITDGDNQTAEVGRPLPDPVHLLVSAPDGNPVDAAEVTVATTDADAEVSVDGATFGPSVTAMTAADGVVTVEWRLGSTPGGKYFTSFFTAALGQ